MVGSKKGQEKTWKGQDNEAFRRIKRLCILSLDFDLDSLGLVFIGRAKTMTNDHVYFSTRLRKVTKSSA